VKTLVYSRERRHRKLELRWDVTYNATYSYETWREWRSLCCNCRGAGRKERLVILKKVERVWTGVCKTAKVYAWPMWWKRFYIQCVPKLSSQWRDCRIWQQPQERDNSDSSCKERLPIFNQRSRSALHPLHRTRKRLPLPFNMVQFFVDFNQCW